LGGGGAGLPGLCDKTSPKPAQWPIKPAQKPAQYQNSKYAHNSFMMPPR